MDPLTVASFGQRHLAKAQDINVLRKHMKNCNLSYIKTTRILKFLSSFVLGLYTYGHFSVLFGLRKCNKINPLRIPGISVISNPGTQFFNF